MLVIIS